MRTLTTIALCTLFTASAGSAFAAKTTTKAGLVAKDAFAAKTGGKLDHAHEVYSFGNGSKEMVLGWRGANTGPGAKGAYMMVVPLGKDRATMLKGTRVSKDLAGAGAKLVRAHLESQGLTGKIELGDHMKSSPRDGQRLKQHPVTRDSGFLRYTVTERNGDQKRYMVWTHPKALGNGRGNVLGKVTLDTDWYGQQPLRPVAE